MHHLHSINNSFLQVTLKRLNAPDGQPDTEIVHAKFVIGADGE